MIEINHLTTPQLLDVSYGDDTDYTRAVEFVNSDNIDLHAIDTAWQVLPYAQHIQQEELSAVYARIVASNQMLFRLERKTRLLFNLEPKKVLSPGIVFDWMISDPKFPKAMYHSIREYQIAMSFVAFKHYAKPYQEAKGAGKMNHLKWLLYFGAVHDLLVGAKTNLYLFTDSPDEYPISLLDDTRLLIMHEDKKDITKLAARLVFNGEAVQQGTIGQETYLANFSSRNRNDL